MLRVFFASLMAFFAISASSAADVLKVATAPNYPPFEFIDDSNKIAGFDIDLLAAVAAKTGVKYELVAMSFDAIIPALKSGKIDGAISAMSATPQRIKAIDFTKPYYTTENLFIKRADNAGLTDKNGLKGKKIGVQLGTVQEIAANEINGAKVAASEDIFGAIMALKSGKIDAVLVDSSIGYGYLKKNSDLVEFLKEPDGSEGFSMAFDKGKQSDFIAKFNAAVEELKADGSFDKLLEKYDLK